jgi:hypothetical protein
MRFRRPVDELLAALLDFVEDPRGTLPAVNPAADLPAHKCFRILLDVRSFEVVASREVQSCTMIWLVLKWTPECHGLSLTHNSLTC